MLFKQANSADMLSSAIINARSSGDRPDPEGDALLRDADRIAAGSSLLVHTDLKI
jgi:hypothetical protein